MKWFFVQFNRMNLVQVIVTVGLTFYVVRQIVENGFQNFLQLLTTDSEEVEVKGFGDEKIE